MSQERHQIQPPMTDQFHQSSHALFSTRAQGGNDLVVSQSCGEGFKRERKFSRVDAEAGERPAGSQCAERIFKCRLRSQGFDRDVDTFAAGEALNFSDDILFVVIEHDIRAHLFCHDCASGIGFDGDNQSGALQLGSGGGAKADGTLGKNGDRIADLNISTLGCGNPCGGDIGDKHYLLVAKIVRNFGQIRLREWNQQIFSLRAVDRIAESPAADGAAALREIASEAIETLSARRDCADQNAVAHFVPSDADAEFMNHSDRLVADCEAGLNGIFALENVEVGAANRSESDADDGFAGAGLGDGNFLDILFGSARGRRGLSLP